jgi:hypothetical protein
VQRGRPVGRQGRPGRSGPCRWAVSCRAVSVSGRGIDHARPRWTEMWLPTATGPAAPVLEEGTDEAGDGTAGPTLPVVR